MTTREYLHKYWILRQFVPIDLAVAVFRKFAPFVPISDDILLHLLEMARAEAWKFTIEVVDFPNEKFCADAPYREDLIKTKIRCYSDADIVDKQSCIYILNRPAKIRPFNFAISGGHNAISVRIYEKITQILPRWRLILAAISLRQKLFTPYFSTLQMDSNRVIRDAD